MASEALYATRAGFDTLASVPTSDLERLAFSADSGSGAVKKAVELQPGQAATVNVTFKATALSTR